MLLFKEASVKVVAILREVKGLGVEAVGLFGYADDWLYTLVFNVGTRDLLKDRE